MARPYTLPEKEIKFTARSGFLTKKLWDEFFNSRTKGWSSIRWRGFQSRKLFRKHTSKLAGNCLVLNKASPDVQRLVGKRALPPPSANYLEEDIVVARLMLKLQKNGLIHDDEYYMRLGIRRMYKENGLWGSEDCLYLPKAIFVMKSKKSFLRIALEVELEFTRKDPFKYRKMIQSYSRRKKIDGVVVVYRGDNLRRSFERMTLRYDYPHHERPIFFIALENLFSEDYCLYFFRSVVCGP